MTTTTTTTTNKNFENRKKMNNDTITSAERQKRFDERKNDTSRLVNTKTTIVDGAVSLKGIVIGVRRVTSKLQIVGNPEVTKMILLVQLDGIYEICEEILKKSDDKEKNTITTENLSVGEKSFVTHKLTIPTGNTIKIDQQEKKSTGGKKNAVKIKSLNNGLVVTDGSIVSVEFSKVPFYLQRGYYIEMLQVFAEESIKGKVTNYFIKCDSVNIINPPRTIRCFNPNWYISNSLEYDILSKCPPPHKYNSIMLLYQYHFLLSQVDSIKGALLDDAIFSVYVPCRNDKRTETYKNSDNVRYRDDINGLLAVYGSIDDNRYPYLGGENFTHPGSGIHSGADVRCIVSSILTEEYVDDESYDIFLKCYTPHDLIEAVNNEKTFKNVGTIEKPRLEKSWGNTNIMGNTNGSSDSHNLWKLNPINCIYYLKVSCEGQTTNFAKKLKIVSGNEFNGLTEDDLKNDFDIDTNNQIKQEQQTTGVKSEDQTPTTTVKSEDHSKSDVKMEETSNTPQHLYPPSSQPEQKEGSLVRGKIEAGCKVVGFVVDYDSLFTMFAPTISFPGKQSKSLIFEALHYLLDMDIFAGDIKLKESEISCNTIEDPILVEEKDDFKNPFNDDPCFPIKNLKEWSKSWHQFIDESSSYDITYLLEFRDKISSMEIQDFIINLKHYGINLRKLLEDSATTPSEESVYLAMKLLRMIMISVVNLKFQKGNGVFRDAKLSGKYINHIKNLDKGHFTKLNSGNETLIREYEFPDVGTRFSKFSFCMYAINRDVLNGGKKRKHK